MALKLFFYFALLSAVVFAEKDTSKAVENERVKKAVIIPPTVPYGYYGGAYGYPYYNGGVYPHGLYDDGKYHPGKYDDGKYHPGKYDDGKYYPGKYEKVATALYKPYGTQAAYNHGYYPYIGHYPYNGYYPHDYHYNKQYLYGGHYASYPYVF